MAVPKVDLVQAHVASQMGTVVQVLAHDRTRAHREAVLALHAHAFFRRDDSLHVAQLRDILTVGHDLSVAPLAPQLVLRVFLDYLGHHSSDLENQDAKAGWPVADVEVQVTTFEAMLQIWAFLTLAVGCFYRLL